MRTAAIRWPGPSACWARRTARGISVATQSSLPRPLNLLAVVAGLPWFHPLPLMDRNRAVFGVNVGHLWEENGKVRAWMGALLKGVDEGWIRPPVDRTFPLAEVGAAHAHIEARKNLGKVVLVT